MEGLIFGILRYWWNNQLNLNNVALLTLPQRWPLSHIAKYL